MKASLPFLKGRLSEPAHAPRTAGGNTIDPGVLSFTSRVGSTCDLGVQTVALTPGASSTCGGGNCSCSSCCCW
jgi:hypothetical protein